VPSTDSNKQQVIAFERQSGIRGLENIGGFNFGSLLAPQSRAELLKASEDPTHALTGPEWLARTFENPLTANSDWTHKAAASSCTLTDNDITFLKKVSGLNLVVSQDGGTTWLDDQGNYPNRSEAEMKELNHLEGQMECDRQCGALKGDVTKDYIEKLFARCGQAGVPFSKDFEDKVLSLFAESNSKKEA
jgi:hypothetical protein